MDGGEAHDLVGADHLLPTMEADTLIADKAFNADARVLEPLAAAGKTAEFAVTVKEVKRKELPEVDDEFASDSAGFDTLEELREDIAAKLREADESRAEADHREAVLDAVVAGAKVTIPEALVEARARELWDRMLHSLSHQGISKETYLQISGKSEDEIIAEARPDAEVALRREAVIAAVVEAEDIEPSDGDVLDALQASAAREGTEPEKLFKRLEKAGRLDEIREDLAQRQAIDFIVEHAKPIPVEQAQAREKLWTPEKDEAAGGAQGSGKLWTPGS